jgi:integrase
MRLLREGAGEGGVDESALFVPWFVVGIDQGGPVVAVAHPRLQDSHRHAGGGDPGAEGVAQIVEADLPYAGCLQRLPEATYGRAARTRSGIFKLLSQVFNFAARHGWCEENPCRSVRRPRVRECSEIRFLNQQELDALIASIDVSAVPFGSTDRAIFLTAAMTGMRQGELLALRWRDVDWEAKRIRVRRNYTRGHWSTPKSRSGERAVPLSAKVEAELRSHLRRSRFAGEDDLVFANPLSGEVLPHGNPACVRAAMNSSTSLFLTRLTESSPNRGRRWARRIAR